MATASSLRASLAFYRRGYLQGRDFFISYSRADANAYVLALAERLTEAGLTCDIDQWGSAPGARIPPSLLHRLQRSQVLLLVGSPRALLSEAVQQEVETFVATGRPIVPITFGSLQTARWSAQVLGLATTVEAADALLRAQPSDAVVARARGSLAYTRQDNRIRRSIWSAVSGLGLLLAVAGFATLQTCAARRDLQVTERQKVAAEAQTTVAVKQKAAAEQQTAVANRARGQALAQAQQAVAAKDTAENQLHSTQQRAQLIDASLRQAQDSLSRTERDLTQTKSDLTRQQQLVRAEQQRLAVAREQGRVLQGTVRERGASTLALLDHMRKVIDTLSTPDAQQTLNNCLLEAVTKNHPLLAHFKPDSYSLTSASRLQLDKLALCLKANPTYKVEVRGHVAQRYWRNKQAEQSGNDDVGSYQLATTSTSSDEYSMKLADNLAEATTKYLILKGVPQLRFIRASYGGRRPLTSLASLDNRAEIALSRPRPDR